MAVPGQLTVYGDSRYLAFEVSFKVCPRMSCEDCLTIHFVGDMDMFTLVRVDYTYRALAKKEYLVIIWDNFC